MNFVNWKQLLFTGLVIGSATLHAEIQSTLTDQSDVSVTIYNQDLALVKDQRNVTLPQGTETLAFRDVSAQIRPETALLRTISGSTITLLEQNFEFDLLTPQKLIEKFVGREIGVVRTHPQSGDEVTEKAILLSANQGVVLKYPDRIEKQAPGRLTFTSVPANLRDRPTLTMLLKTRKAGKKLVELTYLTGGLNWKADYVANLSPDDRFMDINGWVTLTNQSGAQYTNATLKLVAGEVNRAGRQMHPRKMMRTMADGVVAEKSMREEGLFEYHLYTLGRRTTLADNQTKQVALLSATRVPVTKEYVINSTGYGPHRSDIAQKLKTTVYIKFRNDKKSNIGVPLPKGIVRMYKNDSTGSPQFVGEDRIDHTPEKESVSLRLGNAFDITAERRQINYRKRSVRPPYKNAYEVTVEITVKNAKKEPVTVTIPVPMDGEWTIQNETHKHTRTNAHTATWNIRAPAKNKTVLRYTAIVKR